METLGSARSTSFKRVLCCLMLGLVTMAFVGLAVADDDVFSTNGKKPAILHRTQTEGPPQSLLPPGNDDCTGAIPIPSVAPPICSAITTGVLTALPDNVSGIGTDPASCLAAGQYIANSVWYSWVPPANGFYRILSCSGPACGPGSTTLTTDDDGVLAIYDYPPGMDCTGIPTLVGCNDDACHASGPSIIGPIFLLSTETYYILAGNWTQGSAGTAGTVDDYQIRIELANPPANDQCAGAEALTLNMPTAGFMNAITQGNYGPDAACFTSSFQIGNTVTAGAGRDVVYSFTAPDTALYSFYLKHYNSGTGSPDSLLYVTGVCPAANGTITSPDCIYAANRTTPVTTNAIGGSEEASCIPLAANQVVYAIVDEIPTVTVPTSFTIEVSKCVLEREFNGTPGAADDVDTDGDGTGEGPNSAFAACPVNGSIFTFPGFPDIDFYTLGTNPGARLFAIADCNAANPSAAAVDIDMRVTSVTSTYEYDDADNATFFGNFCPNVAGTPLPAGPAYIRLNAFSTTASVEPYRLHTIIRPVGPNPPIVGGFGTSAAAETTEPNDTSFQFADYVYGTHEPTLDYDYYAFSARKGDYIMVNIDGDPTRNATGHRTFLILFDPFGNIIPVAGFGVSASPTTVQVPSPGPGLTATTPRSGGDVLVHRTAVTGPHFILATNGIAIPVTAGDYLYQVSLNCGGLDADMEITKTGSPDPVSAGGQITYTITVTNNGPSAATLASWSDSVAAPASFVSLEAADGWTCTTPSPGDTGAIDCSEDSGTFDGSAVFTLTVQVAYCTGNTSIDNTASASSATPDSDPSNNSSDESTAVTDDGSCEDGDACTENDYCLAGVCVGGGAVDCDDDNVCTDDSCDPDSGCVNDNNTDACDDGNDCTGDDTCGGGSCTGTNLPAGTDCASDDNPCTNDGCDGNGSCAHVNNTDPCDDLNACTTNDTCSGGSCVGGAAPCCDDGNVCTDDTCVPATGCVNACNNDCNSKGHGYWKKLCRNQGGEEPCGPVDDHGDDHGEFYTQKDVDCVNNSCTFSGVSTIAQMCDVLQGHGGDKCSKADRKFMSLLLNVCRCRINAGQGSDSRCGGPPQTVAQRIAATDATLCNPARTSDSCRHPECVTEELTNGEALWQNSLRMTREGSAVRLNWSAVYGEPDTEGVRKYRLWRRVAGGPYTMIGEVNSNTFTFLDTTAGTGVYWYEVTATY